ncbi:MAG: phycobiliprotein lyase [Synechococcaceae cyanobacterium SM2_3_1]|nr:phycobiliprotein lyase [Synechococcaceae cyanobacterium SM2_3_1]
MSTDPPQIHTVTAFFELSAGTWNHQYTSYILPTRGHSRGGKSTIILTPLSPQDPQLQDLLQLSPGSPSSISGLRAAWQGQQDEDTTTYQGSSLLVLLPTSSENPQGELVQQQQTPTDSSVRGRFLLGQDGVLSLQTQIGAVTCEERIWFASENLRLRTRLLQHEGGYSIASFHSEVRKLTAK